VTTNLSVAVISSSSEEKTPGVLLQELLDGCPNSKLNSSARSGSAFHESNPYSHHGADLLPSV
jgi:hypothetical protein